MNSSECYFSTFINRAWGENIYLVDIGKGIYQDSLDQFDNGIFFGQFASVEKVGDNEYVAVRDPLGIRKLFYCRDDSGRLFFSRRYIDLFCYGKKIYSLPAGYKVHLDGNGISPIRCLSSHIVINKKLTASNFKNGSGPFVRVFQDDLEKRLELVFSALLEKEREGWKIYIALSGGLDSTIIAKKSAQFLNAPVACTLDLGESEDAETSVKIAAYFDLEHQVFKATREDILSALEEAPLMSQDYRDFNVHCAALNILLARNIRALADTDPNIDSDRMIIVTGDLMNEYTCDYSGEIIDGKEYYRLPQVGKKKLQQYLISGLDTSDREVSPFSSYGLLCIQPYAILWDLYASIDESVLLSEDPKKLLNIYQIDEIVRSYIPKIKLRAQVGSRDNMGILGLCHSMKMDDKLFLKRLLSNSDSPDREIPLFVGRYDVERMNG